MSGIVQSLKERFGKPLRKRRKLGEDEDEWCDALNNLSVDSSDDDDVYYDAPLEPNVSTASRERRHKQGAKNKSNKVQAPMNYHYSTQPAGRRRTGSNYETSKQPRNAPSHPRETGFKFDAPDSTIGTQTRAGVFHFGVGGSSSSTTSERGTTQPFALNSDRTIGTRSSTSAFPLQSIIPEMGHQYKDGIADNEIEKLATSLMDIENQRVKRFGRELGLEYVGKYCGYGIGKPSHKSKILLMLQDWKGRTPEAQQVQGLLQALKNAHLEQLAGNLHLQDDPVTFKQGFGRTSSSKGRKVTVTLMTSSEPFIIEGLRTKLRALQRSRPNLIEAVKVYQLPYSGLKDHTFKEDVDIMVLCHSIENRNFSITNVTDSLYDEFLEYSNEKLGKNRIVVMAHDFPPEAEEVRAVKMDSFRYSQYSTFENAGLVMICGRMDKGDPEIRDQDWDSFVKFLENASKKPLPSKSSLVGIKGLTEMVQNSVKQCYSSCEIKETELPYSGLDVSFRGKQKRQAKEASKRDAMILCHSVNNRGFSITDVPNSLYNVFLKYCNQLFGLFKFKGRKVTVTLMTSSDPSIIEDLRTKLRALQSSRPNLIEDVKFYQLPYSGLKDHTFKEDVDIMVLCHSIDNRKFSITNVTGSLYDEFLEYSNEKLGKDRIVVMAHDFPPEAEEVRAVKMTSFRHSQYSTFENAGLVMICGRMDKGDPEIRDQDWDSFVKFLENASKKPLPSKSPPVAQTSVPKNVTYNSKPTSKLEERKIKPSTFSSSFSVRMQTRSSKPVIYICTSYGLHSIKGLTEMVQNSVKQCYSSCEIKETELPYSGLDDFKFPSEASKRDAMILCHSVNNRGFSITDVPNSLYNVFLKHCNQLFGKDRVAVIVHDFECSQEILTINLQQFERTQPTAYKLAGLVALAEDLNTSDVKLCYYPESPGLDSFVRKLR